jgi:hypothetical protein
MDAEMNLYDINKQLIAKKPALDFESMDKLMCQIDAWTLSSDNIFNNYYMLLCHEERDYTIFHFKQDSDGCLGSELMECLLNRGEIVDIYPENDVYGIWIRTGGEDFLYYLFPYDRGVVEL